MTPASIIVTVNHAHLARVMDARHRAGLPATPAASDAPHASAHLSSGRGDEAAAALTLSLRTDRPVHITGDPR